MPLFFHSHLLFHLAAREEEIGLRLFLREAEVNHVAGGTDSTLVQNGSLDEGQVALHFLDTATHLNRNAIARGDGTLILHVETGSHTRRL